MAETTTAYEAWDARWRTAEGRAAWLAPDPEVAATAAWARRRGAETALDLGCGVGRHTVMLAELGYRTSALDASEAGLDHTRQALADRGLQADVRLGHMSALPFPDGAFGYVLSLNVIYHGDPPAVRQAIGEIARVLVPGGIYQGTMLSQRNSKYGCGQEVAPDTFVDNEAQGDKAHPHYYASGLDVARLFDSFEILKLEDREQGGPGTWHWYVVAERRADRPSQPPLTDR
jgi:tellurite methyltransferase